MAGAKTESVENLQEEVIKLLEEKTSLIEERGKLLEENEHLKAELARLAVPIDTGPLPPPPPFTFAGAIGGPFMISGTGFGSDIRKGALMIAGRTVPATRWKDHNIKGVLPPDLRSGPTEVIVNGTKITVVL